MSTAGGMVSTDSDVEGMTCGSSALGVQATLGQKAGVSSATVDFQTKVARVVYDPSRVSAEQLTETIAELGFRVAPRTSHRERDD